MSKTIHRAEYDILRDLLREKRVDHGLTQVDVSQRLGRSQSFVSDVERGVRRVDVLELWDLCELFGVQLAEFCKDFEGRAAAVRPAGKRSGKPRARGAAAPSGRHPQKQSAARSGHRPSRK